MADAVGAEQAFFSTCGSSLSVKAAMLAVAGELELEPVMLPRDAFFAAKETVAVGQAAGRVCAEQITPYPPGIPVIIPGERITEELLSYLRSGLAAGMQLPDPADPGLSTIRVVRGTG
jgi:arginine decarboxylase